MTGDAGLDKGELLVLFASIQSPVQHVRENGEGQLHRLEQGQDYPIALIQLAQSRECQPIQRQTALVLLKNYVSKHWSLQLQEDDVKATSFLNEDRKTIVRSQLVELCLCEESNLRKNASAIIGKIAEADYPDEWPDLLPKALALFQSDNSCWFDGAFFILKGLIEDTLSEEQFLMAAPSIVQTLYNLASNTSTTVEQRARIIYLFSGCMETLQMYATTLVEHIRVFAEQSIPPWLNLMQGLLQGADESLASTRLKTECLKAFSLIKTNFPSQISRHLRSLTNDTLALLTQLCEPYRQQCLLSSEHATGRDENEEEISIAVLAESCLKFLDFAFENAVFRQNFEAASREQLLMCCIYFGGLSYQDRIAYEENINEFISSEITSEDSKISVRTLSTDVVLASWESKENELIQKLMSVIRERSDDVLLVESVVHIMRQIEDLEDRWPEGEMGINQFTEKMLALSEAKGNLFLKSSMYLFMSVLKQLFFLDSSNFSHLILQFINEPFECLGAARLRLISSVFSKDDCKSIWQPYLKHTTEKILALIPSTDDETMGFLIESLGSVCGFDFSEWHEKAAFAIKVLFDAAVSHASDQYIVGLVVDALEHVSTDHELFVSTCETIMPQIADILGSQDSTMTTKTATIDLLSSLVRGGPTPLPEGFVGTILMGLRSIVSSAADPEVLQSAQLAVLALVKKDYEQVRAFHTPDDLSGIDICIEMACTLLNPSNEESASLYVSDLVSTVLQKDSSDWGRYVGLLVQQVVGRLGTAAQAVQINNLLNIVAYLFSREPEQMLRVILGISEQSLETVLRVWVDNFRTISGEENIQCNIAGLCNVYRMQNPLVENMPAQGDPIESETDTIRTRSRSKKDPERFHMISMHTKILKLLAEELASVPSSELDMVEEDVSDEEWEQEQEPAPNADRQLSELYEQFNDSNEGQNASRAVEDYVKRFLAECASSTTQNFVHHCNQLNASEQNTIHKLLP